MNQVIMVIPGASAQIPLIKKVKELGYKVVCVNPYENSPAFPYADYCEQYDILNVNDCISVAQHYNVCAVLSDECDIAMPTVAAVSERLSIPSIGSELASLYTNKKRMREFSEKKGFPCPKYRQCSQIVEAKEFFSSLDASKMIMKPLDSNSSRGVYTIQSIKDIDKLFEKSLSFSHSKHVVLCEEYIEGIEFTVDGIVLNEKHYSLAVSKKAHYQHHPNIACELFFSNDDEEFDYIKLRKQNDEYVNQSGLPFGFTHAEYKYNGKEFVLIEIGARGGGNYISSHIVPIMTEMDNYKLLIEQTLNLKESPEYIPKDKLKNRCSVLKFFDIHQEDDGKEIKEVEGEEYLKSSKRVLLYDFNFQKGDILHTASDDSKRVGFYIAYGDTREELLEIMEEIETSVHFKFKQERSNG
ncbi:MAG: ATP-grasp domain-containing protein [Lachnospiraceae bacterium]|nr:ATP-grasp domain-containing protein [Lachnospiraceae bacterium]